MLRALVLLLTAATLSFGQKLDAARGAEILLGDSPHLTATDLRPSEQVTIDVWRNATCNQKKCLAHAQGTYLADAQGKIDLDTAAPISGTYSGPDPLGLLWSGIEEEWRDLYLKPGQVLVRMNNITLALQLTSGRSRVDLQSVAEPGLNGAFARPKANSGTLPAIILLHGSNGGDKAGAEAEAVRFAHLGYAAFALNYFSWAPLGDTPTALVNIPVEALETARKWLAKQPAVATDQVAIWGGSKGAEFALVAATALPWIHRVVACVPSSVVWSGFGREAQPGEVYSSWKVGGKSLPYIGYDHYEEVFQNKLSAAAVHHRSLEKASAEERAAARIPIEKTSAQILLLGATKDHVWPSGEMIPAIESAMRQAGKADQLRAFVFPAASHFICGTGAELQRIDPVVNPEGNSPSPDATARAAAKAWAETKAFLAIQ